MAKNGTIAYISTPKKCDFPHLVRDGKVNAEYDFRTTTGQWANGCERHYIAHRMYDELGMGKGQQLVLETVEEPSKPALTSSSMTVAPNEHDSSDLV